LGLSASICGLLAVKIHIKGRSKVNFYCKNLL